MNESAQDSRKFQPCSAALLDNDMSEIRLMSNIRFIFEVFTIVFVGTAARANCIDAAQKSTGVHGNCYGALVRSSCCKGKTGSRCRCRAVLSQTMCTYETCNF